ncbi:type IV pilus twitching motility protein PilT, partial [Oceanidesulfovibrio marinus]
RVNFYLQSRGIAAAFREIPEEILTIEQLELPQLLAQLAMLNKGLVLVTGPTGSGKATTLAAIMDYAKKVSKDHILSIEDPIECGHQPKTWLITQREVGRYTKTFSAALRVALREDPDIVLVGEMRDLEPIKLSLEAAETGHLVFSTLHSISAAKSIERILEFFPGDQQGHIRSALSES